MIDLSDAREQQLVISDALARDYDLDRWAGSFSLMTAGYRDRLDPQDASSSEAPFNTVTVAIMAEAKARVIRAAFAPGQVGDVHVAGEVRPHTQTFIDLAARIYAAHGIRVHLRRGVRTTPIWYSSFGIFHEELEGGENFTASHSAYIKGGWKPLDGEGQQLLAEEPDVVREVRAIVSERATIRIARRDAPEIHADFDVDAAYASFQRSVLGEPLLQTLVRAGAAGFRVAIYPLGGSIGATSRRLFERLGVSVGPDGMIRYFLDEEDAEYHRLGVIDGEVHGVDPTESVIYRRVGVEDGLLDGDFEMAVLFDADADRTKVVSAAPASLAGRARSFGLEVVTREGCDRCAVFFEPNQLYMILVAFRIEALRASGDLDRHDWFVGLSHPTSTSIEELAHAMGLPSVRVPVGFKYVGDLCRKLEAQLGGDAPVRFTTDTGETIELGRNPRGIIFCEESGGATLGGVEPLRSRHGAHQMLALREKDGFQICLLSLALGAQLFEAGSSPAAYYCDQAERHAIQHLHYERFDVKLYDEGLLGAELARAREQGTARRDAIMATFRGFAERVVAGQLSLSALRGEIDGQSRDEYPMPELERVAIVGDGVLMQAKGKRFLLRASGTDALLRYYVEGHDPADVESWGRMLISVEPKA